MTTDNPTLQSDKLEPCPCPLCRGSVGPRDLTAYKWAETLSTGEQDVLLTSSLRRLQKMIDSRAPVVANQNDDERPVIDVTKQHDFIQIAGSDRCGLRGCTLGVLEHAWIPPLPSPASSPVPPEQQKNRRGWCEDCGSKNIIIVREFATADEFIDAYNAAATSTPVEQEHRWRCACGWCGTPSQMTVSNDLRTCPNCGGSGGLFLDAIESPKRDKCEHGVLWSMECLSCGPSDFVAATSTPSPSVREAAEEIDQWTRRAYPFGSGMTEEARLTKLTEILSSHMSASLAGDRDLISRSALLKELKNSHATCIKNAEQDGRETVRVMMEHFAEAGRQIIERVENFPAVSAAGGDEDGNRQFVVHGPTGVVNCNDPKCPVGATIEGWPHRFNAPDCIYHATVEPREQACPACDHCAHWGEDCSVDGCWCTCRGD